MSGVEQVRQLPSILLIDDDVISREVMPMMLEMHGFTVETAEDGDAALRLLQDSGKQPGVILMDTQMPGLSGVALVRALRADSRARIVAISASEPGEAIRQAVDGFLLKPVQPEDVIALLDAAQGAPVAEKSATAETAEVIDPVVLGKLKAMMPASSVLEIYAATATDLKERLAALQTAMDTANSAEVARIAHAIKGACAMVGLSGAREAAARLEISNAPVTWPEEVVQLHIALRGLEGMLGDGFPA